MAILPLAVIVGLICFVYFRRDKDPGHRTFFLRKVALYLMLVLGAFGTVFVVGEIMTDPGGVKGMLLAAAWLLPVAALSYLAWRKPKIATPYIWVASLLSIILSISLALASAWWTDVMNHRGPIVAMVTFAVGIPVAIWARNWNTVGGLLLIVIGLAPVVCSLIAFGFGFATAATSISVASAPSVISGLLYLLPERKLSNA
jgi:hypothetical protein